MGLIKLVAAWDQQNFDLNYVMCHPRPMITHKGFCKNDFIILVTLLAPERTLCFD